MDGGKGLASGLAVETAALAASLEAQRKAVLFDPEPSAAVREDRIDRLIDAVGSNADRLGDALGADFGRRHPLQSMVTDVAATLNVLGHSRRRVSRWMRDVAGPGTWLLRGAGVRAALRYEPLGVVGIVSPWNFPVELSLHPLGQAFAAGNRAMLKVSEATPRTAAVLADILGARFDPTELVVVEGDSSVAAAFCSLPFDHLFFTGSTETGRRVAGAAASNLVPTTLELGGRCPVVVGEGADIDAAARAIVFGKTLNAGQFCIAPNHVFVPRHQHDELVQRCEQAAGQLFPRGLDSEATAIVDVRHHRRLQHLAADAAARGAEIKPLASVVEASADARVMPPTLILQPVPEMAVCSEEIFGPLLPVHDYENLDDVIRQINAGPCPLAAYYFGGDDDDRRRFVQRVRCGGITVNDVMVHVGLESLPFGGVGASGSGVYHGRAGFETFSHLKPVVEVPRRSLTRLLHPPYPAAAGRAIDLYVRAAALGARRRMAKRGTAR